MDGQDSPTLQPGRQPEFLLGFGQTQIRSNGGIQARFRSARVALQII